MVRNVMENTFRTRLRHLRSIWDGPKCYTSANKSAIFLVHLASVYSVCEFPMHRRNSDHVKINDRMHIQAFFECDTPVHPPGSLQTCSTDPKSGPKSHFFTHMEIVRNLVKNAIFEKVLTTCEKSSEFKGRFRTKECSKRKVSGDLNGPKCDGEYISALFDTFEVDLEWSEMLYWCQ